MRDIKNNFKVYLYANNKTNKQICLTCFWYKNIILLKNYRREYETIY